MKLVTLALLISAAIFLVGACSRSNPVTTDQTSPIGAASPAGKVTTPSDDLDVARVNYRKNCMGCHGEDGSGGEKTVDGKKVRVPSFREGHALKHSDEEFIEQITKGGDGMPAFLEKLWPEEMNGLVLHIRKEFQGK